MSPSESETSEESTSRTKSIFRMIGIFFAFLTLLVFFTLSKLPDDRIGPLLLEKLNGSLYSSGIPAKISAEKTNITIFLGRLRLEKVKIRHSSNSGHPVDIELDEARISPSILDLLFGRFGGTVRLYKKDSKLLSSFWVTKSQKFSLNMNLENADLGSNGIGIIPIFLGVSAILPVSGEIDLAGEMHNLNSINGNLSLKVQKGELSGQKIVLFNIPTSRFQSGDIQIKFSSGKVLLEKVRLGTMDLSKDDLNVSASGELELGRDISQSRLNLNTKIKLSENLMKSLSLLDSFIGQTKQPDGSYSMRLQGPIQQPNILPGGN